MGSTIDAGPNNRYHHSPSNSHTTTDSDVATLVKHVKEIEANKPKIQESVRKIDLDVFKKPFTPVAQAPPKIQVTNPTPPQTLRNEVKNIEAVKTIETPVIPPRSKPVPSATSITADIPKSLDSIIANSNKRSRSRDRSPNQSINNKPVATTVGPKVTPTPATVPVPNKIIFEDFEGHMKSSNSPSYSSDSEIIPSKMTKTQQNIAAGTRAVVNKSRPIRKWQNTDLNDSIVPVRAPSLTTTSTSSDSTTIDKSSNVGQMSRGRSNFNRKSDNSNATTEIKNNLSSTSVYSESDSDFMSKDSAWNDNPYDSKNQSVNNINIDV